MTTIIQQRDDLAAFANGIGQAIRGDWGSIDGRSQQLFIGDGVAMILAGDSLGEALAVAGVCPENLTWDEHCDEREPDTDWCIHGWAAFEADRERFR